MLNYTQISKNEIAKYQKIFTKMNQISNPRHENFSSKQTDKYLLLAKEFKMPLETIRKLLIKTSRIKWIKNQENRIKIKRYNCQICNLNVIPLSITADNGVENHQLKTLKKQFPTIENFYSTHSYAGWEKETIEQKNKQFRKFRRKGQSMDVLTQNDCDLISLVINCETYLQNQKNIA